MNKTISSFSLLALFGFILQFHSGNTHSSEKYLEARMQMEKQLKVIESEGYQPLTALLETASVILPGKHILDNYRLTNKIWDVRKSANQMMLKFTYLSPEEQLSMFPYLINEVREILNNRKTVHYLKAFITPVGELQTSNFANKWQVLDLAYCILLIFIILKMHSQKKLRMKLITGNGNGREISISLPLFIIPIWLVLLII